MVGLSYLKKFFGSLGKTGDDAPGCVGSFSKVLADRIGRSFECDASGINNI
jgi:hypothetical protein